MRTVIAIMALVIASSSAWAQTRPQTYTFKMTPAQADMMVGQLGRMDWATVNELLSQIIAQAREQNIAVQQPPAAPTPAPAPDTPK
jgi:hypothetical protein